MTLSDRILAADPDDAAEILRELATLIDGLVTANVNRAISAGAYLSAAEMLVPEGWRMSISNVVGPGFHACVCSYAGMSFGEAYARAPTAWQALAAAIAKSKDR